MIGVALRNDLLVAIGAQPYDSASRIGGPQRAVGFGENALRPLQALSNVTDCCFVYFEICNRIRLHELSVRKFDVFEKLVCAEIGRRGKETGDLHFFVACILQHMY